MTTEFFEKNLERFKKVAYGDVHSISEKVCTTTELTQSEQGIHNLKKKFGDEELLFYEQEDPIHGSLKWASTLNLKNVNLIIVYGLGLGYYYEPFRKWLDDDPKRQLLFIEDDSEIIIRFLETEYADFILKKSNVKILYLETLDRSLSKLDDVCDKYIGYKYKISAIGPYLRKKSSQLMRLNNLLGFLFTMNEMIHQEYRRFSIPFFLNYYLNLFTLPESYLAKSLWNKFNNVPAIICGAGPSLDKNIETIKKLHHNALIFAGSTSMNALNAAGILPHFGVGIDPNPSQLHRIISNNAFQVPYFVNFRMNSFALNAIHGDHIYVNGASAYEISKWVDQELDIDGPTIVEGYNVINYALSIATAMGCYPIIMVGVDLAYTEGKSYAKLTPEHPLYMGQDKFLTKNLNEDLVARKDVNGNEIFTLWKWIMESIWYSKYALEHSEKEIFNASEGLGFPGIKHKKLEDLAEEHLLKCYDLEGMIHAEMQSHGKMPEEVTISKIQTIMQTLHKSTQNCIENCKEISSSYRELLEKIAQKNEYPSNLLTPKIIENISQMDSEIAYKHTLILYVQHLIEILKKEIEKLELDKEWLNKEDLDQEFAKIHLSRFEFVREAAEKNLIVLDNAINVIHQHEKRKKEFQNPKDNNENLRSKDTPDAIYSFKNSILTIEDPFFGINIKKEFKNINEAKSFYENGQIKSVNYYEDNLLQGPSKFYHENGQLLSESWFIEGQKIGRAIAYYYNGETYSINNYLNGKLHGKQEFYYQNNKLRSILSYREGKLNGDILLFYENGQIKRKISFVNDAKEGFETFWNYEGTKIGEATFHNNLPIDKTFFWNENNILQKEIEFDENGKIKNLKFWNRNGEEVDISEIVGTDYFDSVAIKLENFTQNLSEIADNLEKVGSFIRQEDVKEIMRLEIENIRLEINKLTELNKSMRNEVGLDQSSKEAIWKTPTMQENIEEMMEKFSTILKEKIEKIQTSFVEALNTLIK